MPNFEQETEFNLWKRFKNGDKNALDVIFKRYYAALYNYGNKLIKNPTLTEDCLQDFFLYIYEHRQNLKDLTSIKPYLFKAFRNRLLKYLKSNTNLIALEELDTIGLPIEFSIEEIMIKQENSQLQRAQISNLLNQLTNRQKELVYLKYYNNLNIKDIAEIIGISYQGVVNGLSKTIKKLKKAPMILFLFTLLKLF